MTNPQDKILRNKILRITCGIKTTTKDLYPAIPHHQMTSSVATGFCPSAPSPTTHHTLRGLIKNVY